MHVFIYTYKKIALTYLNVHRQLPNLLNNCNKILDRTLERANTNILEQIPLIFFVRHSDIISMT